MLKPLLLILSSMLLISCNNSEIIVKKPQLFSTVNFGKGNIQLVPINIYSAKEISVPESITVSPDKKIYVSNIGGNPLESNGKGFISKFSDGLWSTVITNLDDPKGLQFINNNLAIVSDHPSVKLIDISTKTVLKTHRIPNAGFLNDLVKLNNSEFALSDTGTGNVIKITLNQSNNQITTQTLISSEQLGGNGVNGVIFDPDTSVLYMVTSSFGGNTNQSHIWKIKLDGNYNPISAPKKWFDTALGNRKLDGLTLTTTKDKLLVSDWSSDNEPASVYIFDTTSMKQLAVIQGNFDNAADITLDGTTLYLPLFTDNQIAKMDLSSIL